MEIGCWPTQAKADPAFALGLSALHLGNVSSVPVFLNIMARMSKGNAVALFLNDTAVNDEIILECPDCRRRYRIIGYLADPQLLRDSFCKQTHFDHEKDPDNVQPHKDIIQL